jgi:hypothetical protein
MDFLKVFILLCFICRPSESIVSEDDRIEYRTVTTLAKAVRSSNHVRLDLKMPLHIYCFIEKYPFQEDSSLYPQQDRPWFTDNMEERPLESGLIL